MSSANWDSAISVGSAANTSSVLEKVLRRLLRGSTKSRVADIKCRSELEIRRVTAARLDPAGIGIVLLTHPDGHTIDEAIARGHRAASRSRAIGRIGRPLASIVAAARHVAVHACTAKASPIADAAIHASAIIERRLEAHAHGGKVAGRRILDEAGEISGHGIGTFRRILGDLIGALRVAVATSAKVAVERFQLVASIGTILDRIAPTRASPAAAAATARTAGAVPPSDLAAARRDEKRAHYYEDQASRRKRKGFHGAMVSCSKDFAKGEAWEQNTARSNVPFSDLPTKLLTTTSFPGGSMRLDGGSLARAALRGRSSLATAKPRVDAHGHLQSDVRFGSWGSASLGGTRAEQRERQPVGR